MFPPHIRRDGWDVIPIAVRALGDPVPKAVMIASFAIMKVGPRVVPVVNRMLDVDREEIDVAEVLFRVGFQSDEVLRGMISEIVALFEKIEIPVVGLHVGFDFVLPF